MPFRRRKDDAPDLHTQLEQLLDQVWDSERRERMNDRIDNAARADELRPKRQRDRGRKINRPPAN